MHEENQRAPRPTSGSSLGADNRPSVSSRFEKFEKRQGELWRLTFAVLFLLVLAYAWTSWDAVRSLTHHFEALPIGLVILVALFGVYLWKKTSEISELRGLMRGLEQRDAEPPSGEQLDQLFEIIARSQQGYRDLIDSFDDVLLALSLDGQIRAVNRSFSDLVDTPFQQIIGRPLAEFVQEGGGDASELVKRAMPRFMERRHWAGVVQVRLKSQPSVFYFDCVAHAMMRADEIQGITILGRDVSALRKNEARFTELFESLQEGIYITTPDGSILDANPALVRMLGYDSKEDLLKRRVAEILVDPVERKILRDQVERQSVLQGREITLVRKDGTSIVCLHTAAAVRDNGGTVVRYQGAVMDITERREMERRLHQQQEFARRLVDSFPDLILVLDTASHYTFVSPRCKDVLGYELEETRNMEFGGRTHPEDLPALMLLYSDIIAGKQTFASMEIRVRHKLGDWRRIRFNFSPLWDAKGQIEGVVLSGRDVTDLKRLEEQLIQAEKLAAMGQMLAGVAHELNNPLTAILGVTELLREREGTDEPTKRQLELTHRQARRAARIVQNLLEFSRPASPLKKTLDVNGLVERTLQLHEHSLRRNSIEVDFHPLAGLPGVIGDANQLIQVFLNLVTNAEQAIREVRDTGRIQVRLASSANRVTMTVQDDGVGIRPDALPRIFDPFYTTKRPGGGTGLGLSICMSIIREHGGTIEVEPVVTGGSVFQVTLPIAQNQASVPPPHNGGPQLAEAGPQNLAQLAGRSVLVIDDEEGILEMVQAGLTAQGLKVDCAPNDGIALRLAAQNVYDVILCDVNLTGPGQTLSGEQVCDRIQSMDTASRTVFVFMTGAMMDAAKMPSLEEKARCIQKPFRVSDLLAVLGEVMSRGPAEPLKS